MGRSKQVLPLSVGTPVLLLRGRGHGEVQARRHNIGERAIITGVVMHDKRNPTYSVAVNGYTDQTDHVNCEVLPL